MKAKLRLRPATAGQVGVLAVVAMVAFGLKRHYADATTDALSWILTPTAHVVGLVTGVAFAIGAPVAAVTSLVIGAFVIGVFVPDSDLAGPILRGGVLAAVAVAPAVAVAAAAWVLAVRRFARPPAVVVASSDPAAADPADPSREPR